MRAGGGGGRATLLKPARQVTQRSPLGEHPKPLPLGETERGRGRGIPPNLSRRGSTLSLAADRAVFTLRSFPLPRAALGPTLPPTLRVALDVRDGKTRGPHRDRWFYRCSPGSGSALPTSEAELAHSVHGGPQPQDVLNHFGLYSPLPRIRCSHRLALGHHGERCCGRHGPVPGLPQDPARLSAWIKEAHGRHAALASQRRPWHAEHTLRWRPSNPGLPRALLAAYHQYL